jgi:hypothetical protein
MALADQFDLILPERLYTQIAVIFLAAILNVDFARGR